MALRPAGRSGQGGGRSPGAPPALGNPGDVKPVGEGVSELRIHYGPGYRVYYVQRGGLLIVLLCGGNKSAQAQDIALALKLAKEV